MCVHLLEDVRCLVLCAMCPASVDAIILTVGAFITVLGLSVCGCLYAAILALQATRGPRCSFVQYMALAKGMVLYLQQKAA